jgi:hypothetical protein
MCDERAPGVIPKKEIGGKCCGECPEMLLCASQASRLPVGPEPEEARDEAAVSMQTIGLCEETPWSLVLGYKADCLAKEIDPRLGIAEGRLNESELY